MLCGELQHTTHTHYYEDCCCWWWWLTTTLVGLMSLARKGWAIVWIMIDFNLCRDCCCEEEEPAADTTSYYA